MLTDKSPGHIVFISHEASVSGAPVALLNLLLLLQQKTSLRITLVISRGGPFLPTFRQHFPVIVLKPQGYGKGNPVKRIIEILHNRLQLARVVLKVMSSDAIFSNTIVNGRLLKTLSFLHKPAITYVHELDEVIRLLLASGDAQYALYQSHRLAYPSEKVKNALQQGFQAPAAKLQRLNYYFPTDKAQLAEATRATIIQLFKQRYGLAPDSLLIGGMGSVSQRKGTDIFIDVCEQVIAQDDTIRFCWIGGFENEQTEASLKKRVQERKLEKHIVFTGLLPHNYYNLAAFDLFFLSSREDPYPLVALEAALMKVPSLCFEPSGGIPEFVGEDAGWVVPGFDVQAAAQTILALRNNRPLLKEKGEQAFQKCLRLHGDPALVLEQFTTIVNG